MSVVINKRRRAGAILAGGAFVVLAAAASPAHADGVATPIKARTEGGSLELKSGDIVACAGVGDVRVVDTKGMEHKTDGPGTLFTTPAGVEVETLHTGVVEVTFDGASAVIKCGPELFPTTNAFVPRGPSLSGTGGGIRLPSVTESAVGGTLVAAGLTTSVVVLRRRTVRGD